MEIENETPAEEKRGITRGQKLLIFLAIAAGGLAYWLYRRAKVAGTIADAIEDAAPAPEPIAGNIGNPATKVKGKPGRPKSAKTVKAEVVPPVEPPAP